MKGAGPSRRWLSVFLAVRPIFGQRRVEGGVNTQPPQRGARGGTVLRPSGARRIVSRAVPVKPCVVVDGFSSWLSEKRRSCQAFLRDNRVRMKP
jgi:hypothetical protein